MPKTRHDIDRATKVTGLLDVAEQSFRDKGYAATTTAAVARAAGVTQNSLYWYFPSKDHLFVAVLDRMLAALVADARAHRGRPITGQIIRVTERLEETQSLEGAVADRARESPVVADFAARMRLTLQQVLLEGIKAEVPTADHDVLAQAILALAHGTRGMPRAARRRVLTFGIAKLLGAKS